MCLSKTLIKVWLLRDNNDMPDDVRMTSLLFLQALGVALVLDMLVGAVLYQIMRPDLFRQLGVIILVISGLFFGVVWTIVLAWGWDWFYVYVFPMWMKDMGWAWGVAYALVGWGMWWVAKRFRKPLLVWAALGGLEGIVTHAWAIWVGGVVSKPPIIQGANPWAVLAFACFEKMFYWLVILGIASGLDHILSQKRQDVV